MVEGLVFLGVNNNEKAVKYLLEEDPCFGRQYAKTAAECSRCRAPVLLNGKVSLLNEVCKSLTQEDTIPVQVKKLTSKQVIDKIQAGLSPTEIISEMVGDEPSYQQVKEARTLLAVRMSYIKNNKNLPVPEVPTLRELWNGEEAESL
jgi:hypothetical protein